MSDLRERLDQALGASYRLERELGGGGMSRVFLAEEMEFGRRVVIKVLPPEMAAGVNQDRFRREIQLAARLQHPHIVPLLTAGAKDDLLWYVMPFIAGESLRTKLAREGELPVAEALRVLRNVLDALAYAHRSGVVHRDIKPDNVLLSEGHAVVTDFGVAKAVSESTGGMALTSLGVALGTPAYMAPEQAAANPNVDHRADLYAVGALAYEMLTGRPPFTGMNVQAVLSAHLIQAPEPVTAHRPTVPEGLNQLILKCLEKHAADRPQRAEELVPHVEAMLTPTGGTTPAGTDPVISSGTRAAIRWAHPLRVAALFGVSAAAVLALVYAVMWAVGLPDWVLAGAAMLLALGLPIMLVTGHHERQRALARATGVVVTTPQGDVRRWFTWRRALLGGGVAFAGLGLITAGYMAMRVLGIGPVGTLVATGVLQERDRLVLADFDNHTSDPTLGRAITEALRVDLAQSPVVRLMDAADAGAALRRMGREPSQAAAFDVPLAREIAQREGAKAVVSGEVAALGSGFVLSVELVSAAEGNTLVALRETAKSEDDVIGAVDRLSAKLRERIGESLRAIRASGPLARVSTASLEALKLYSRAVERNELEGDPEGALAMLDEAVTIDTAFAMAWRKIAVIHTNTGISPSAAAAAGTKAYQLRGRLPELERLQAEAFYYDAVNDEEQAIRVYRSLLGRDPDDITALNNLGRRLNLRHEFAEAERLVRHGLSVRPMQPLYTNLAAALAGQGRLAALDTVVEQAFRDLPDSPAPALWRAWMPGLTRDYVALDSAMRHFIEAETRAPNWRWWGHFVLAAANEAMGKLDDARRYRRAQMRIDEARGVLRGVVSGTVEIALIELRYRQDPRTAVALVDDALQRYPLGQMDPADRPYAELVHFFAVAGEPARARALAAQWDREVAEPLQRASLMRHAARARLALLRGDTAAAIQHYQGWHREPRCTTCGYFEVAATYDGGGRTDSALVWYRKVVDTPGLFNPVTEHDELAPTYRRLGELYEQRGDLDQAVDFYNRFIELWEDADPELQPRVDEVRRRLARLVAER